MRARLRELHPGDRRCRLIGHLAHAERETAGQPVRSRRRRAHERADQDIATVVGTDADDAADVDVGRERPDPPRVGRAPAEPGRLPHRDRVGEAGRGQQQVAIDHEGLETAAAQQAGQGDRARDRLHGDPDPVVASHLPPAQQQRLLPTRERGDDGRRGETQQQVGGGLRDGVSDDDGAKREENRREDPERQVHPKAGVLRTRLHVPLFDEEVVHATIHQRLQQDDEGARDGVGAEFGPTQHARGDEAEREGRELRPCPRQEP